MIILANAFTDGVGKGGLHNTEDIRLLVLYVLFVADVPFSMQSITASITESELANFFEVTNAVKSCCDDGLAVCNDSLYSLTEKGKQSISELKTVLNYYVLEEAKRSTSKQVILARRLQENDVKITPDNNGYTVNISMLEQSREIFGLNVHVGTLQDAEKVKTRFLNDPSAIYSANISLLLGYDINSEKD